jgi:hypothetical protein
MKTYLLSVGGVLRKTVGGSTISDGISLYHGLAKVGQVVLVCYGEPSDEVYAWLELHGLTSHTFVSFAGRHTANELRREGYDIGMVVVPDPEEAISLIRAGFTTVLFTHARYAQPQWRPDAGKGIRAWSEIVEETAKVAKMKANDSRLKDGE